MQPVLPLIIQQIHSGLPPEAYNSDWQRELRESDKRDSLTRWLLEHNSDMNISPENVEGYWELLRALTATGTPAEDTKLAQISALFQATLPRLDEEDRFNMRDEASEHELNRSAEIFESEEHAFETLASLPPMKLSQSAQLKLAARFIREVKEAVWLEPPASRIKDNLLLWLNRGDNKFFFKQLFENVKMDDLLIYLCRTDDIDDCILRRVILDKNVTPLLEHILKNKDRSVLSPDILVDLAAARIFDSTAGQAFLEANSLQDIETEDEETGALLNMCMNPEKLKDHADDIYKLTDGAIPWVSWPAILPLLDDSKGLDFVESYLAKEPGKVVREFIASDPLLVARLIENGKLRTLHALLGLALKDGCGGIVVEQLLRPYADGTTALMKLAQKRPYEYTAVIDRALDTVQKFSPANLLATHLNQLDLDGFSLLDHCLIAGFLPRIFNKNSGDLNRDAFGAGLTDKVITDYLLIWEKSRGRQCPSPLRVFPNERLLPYLHLFIAEDVKKILQAAVRAGSTREEILESWKKKDSLFLSRSFQPPPHGFLGQDPATTYALLREFLEPAQFRALMTEPINGFTCITSILDWPSVNASWWLHEALMLFNNDNERLAQALLEKGPSGKSYFNVLIDNIIKTHKETPCLESELHFFLSNIVPVNQREAIISEHPELFQLSTIASKKDLEDLYFKNLSGAALGKIFDKQPALFYSLIEKRPQHVTTLLTDRNLETEILKRILSSNLPGSEDTFMHHICRKNTDLALLENRLEASDREKLLCLKGKNGWTPWAIKLQLCREIPEMENVCRLIPRETRLEAIRSREGWLNAICGGVEGLQFDDPAIEGRDGVQENALLGGALAGAALGAGLGEAIGGAGRRGEEREDRDGGGLGMLIGGILGLALGAFAGAAMGNRPARRRARGRIPEHNLGLVKMNGNACNRAAVLLKDLEPAELDTLLRNHPGLALGLLRQNAIQALEILIRKAPSKTLMDQLGNFEWISDEHRALLLDLIQRVGSEELQDYWLEPLLSVNPAHLIAPIAEIALPPIPEPVRILDIVGLYQGINFSDPKAPGYNDPNRLMNDSTHIKLEDTVNNLTNMLTYATEEKPGHYGVPNHKSKPEAFREYYKKLKNLLEHIAYDAKRITREAQALIAQANIVEDEIERAELRKKADVLLQRVATHLIDLAIGAEYCGTRWMSQTNECCIQLLPEGGAGTEETQKLDQQILRRLRDLRFGTIQNIVAINHQGNVHSYNRYMALLANELGINQAGGHYPEDPYANRNLTVYEARRAFDRRYTAPYIIDHIDQAISSDQSLRLLIHDWLTEQGVEEWDREHWENLLRASRSNNPQEALAELGVDYTPGDPDSVLDRSLERIKKVNYDEFCLAIDAASQKGLMEVFRTAGKYGIQGIRSGDEAKALMKKRQTEGVEHIEELKRQVAAIRTNAAIKPDAKREAFSKLNIPGYSPDTDKTPEDFIKDLRRSKYGETLYYPEGHPRAGQLRRVCIRRLLSGLNVLV